MSTSDGAGDDFTAVTHKKTRAPKKRKGQPKPRERTLNERVEARRTVLEASGYPARCRGELRVSSSLLQSHFVPAIVLLRSALGGTAGEKCPPPVCAVCLGLGSVAESSKSQDQLVLLQMLLKELEPTVRRVLLVTVLQLTDRLPHGHS